MVKTRVATAGQVLEEKIAKLEREKSALEQIVYQERGDLRDARKKVDELQERINQLTADKAALARSLGVLEGYRQRVERIDDLEYGRPPMERVEGGVTFDRDGCDMDVGHRPGDYVRRFWRR